MFMPKFPKMVSGYYKHVSLDSKDPTQLDNVGDPSRKPTTETMTPEELASVIDFAPFVKCEIPLLVPAYKSSIFNQTKKAFVDSKVREGWGGIPAWYLCGDSSLPLFQAAPWFLEEAIGSENFNFKLIRDANHFVSFYDFFLHHSFNCRLFRFPVDVGRARSIFDCDERMYTSLRLCLLS